MGELVTIMPCANAVGNFIPSLATFVGKKYRSEFADGFPDCSLETMILGGQMKKALITWLCHFQAHGVARFPLF
jgi:hypothetical protein